MTSLENYLDPLFYSYFKRPIQQTLCYEVIQAGRVIKYSDKTVLISSDDEKWYEVTFKNPTTPFQEIKLSLNLENYWDPIKCRSDYCLRAIVKFNEEKQSIFMLRLIDNIQTTYENIMRQIFPFNESLM